MQLYDLLKLCNDGFDVCDDVFDFGVYFPYIESEDDSYDKLLNFIAKRVDVIKYQKDWFTICDFTSFIKKYQVVIDKFLNDEYYEEYTPEYLCKKYNLKELTIESDSELYYEVYIEDFFKRVVVGGYAEEEYKLLYNKLVNSKKN